MTCVIFELQRFIVRATAEVSAFLAKSQFPCHLRLQVLTVLSRRMDDIQEERETDYHGFKFLAF